MKNKKISIKTIAEECNVGIGTVSRYFNNGYISPEKRARIQKVVEKYNFVPNFAAQRIKKHVPEIYILIPDLTSSNTYIVKTILDQINRQLPQVKTFISQTTYEQDSYLAVLKEVLRRKPTCLILFTISNDNQIKNFVNSLEIPIIAYGRQWGKNVFINNDYEMYNDLLEKLNVNDEFKHKSLVYIGIDPQNIPTGAFRYEAVKGWVSKYNYPAEYYFFQKNSENDIWKAISQIDFNNKIIICGTHTSYRTITAYLYKNAINQYVITDIRNDDIFLISELSHHYWIAIDYKNLALQIVDRLQKILLYGGTKDFFIRYLKYKILP